MRAMTWLMAMALLLALPAARAQQVLASSSVAPPPGSALPPPGINDPGATPRPAASARASAAPEAVPLPHTGIPPSIAPAARQQQGEGDSTNVGAHTNSAGDQIQQTSRGGVVYSETLTPRHGVKQTYKYTSPNGSLVPDPNLGPVQPVYYTLYQWNGPRKQVQPANGSSAAAPAPAPAPAPATSGR